MRRISQEAATAAGSPRWPPRSGPTSSSPATSPSWPSRSRPHGAGVRGVPWVFWLQDLHSVAMTAEVEKRAAGWAGASAPASRRSSGACCARPTGSSPSPRTSAPCSRPGASTGPTAPSSRTGRRSPTCPAAPRQRVAHPPGAGRPLRVPLHGHAGPQAPARAAVPAGGPARRRRRGRGDQRGHGRGPPARDAARAAPAQPAPAAVPAHRALPRRARGGRRAGGPARAHGRHVLGAVQGALVPVRRPPHPGRDPAREPGGPHHRAGGRRAGRVTDRRGGLPRGGQAAAGRRGGAHGRGPERRAYAEATFDTEVITDRFQHVIERAISRSTTLARARS